MRRDEQRLNDILDALETVSRFVGSKSEAEFLDDEVLRYAVAQQLSVVGEAGARISADLRQRYPSVPWTGIIGFRNVVVHEYFGIHWRNAINCLVSKPVPTFPAKTKSSPSK